MAHVSKITDIGVVRLVRACARLRSVDVNFCTNLGDMAVLELATLPSLRRLSLVQLPQLTDNAVFFLAEHTPTLERLHLSHCDGLSLDSIHHAIRKLPELVHLSATGVPALSRPGVERFSEQPSQNSPPGNQELFRVFTNDKIALLCAFLDKEMERQREAEAQNYIFVPRADDAKDLY